GGELVADGKEAAPGAPALRHGDLHLRFKRQGEEAPTELVEPFQLVGGYAVSGDIEEAAVATGGADGVGYGKACRARPALHQGRDVDHRQTLIRRRSVSSHVALQFGKSPGARLQ